MPQDLGGATVVHGGRPDGENDVLGGEGTIINKSLVLVHTGVKRNIIILAPATERVEEEDGVLIALFDELLTGIFKQEHVAIVERVSNLEAIHSISTTSSNLLNNLTGSVSVLVHTVVELDALEEASALSGDEPVALGHDGLGLGVLGGEGTESTGADLLLSVVEE